MMYAPIATQDDDLECPASPSTPKAQRGRGLSNGGHPSSIRTPQFRRAPPPDAKLNAFDRERNEIMWRLIRYTIILFPYFVLFAIYLAGSPSSSSSSSSSSASATNAAAANSQSGASLNLSANANQDFILQANERQNLTNQSQLQQTCAQQRLNKLAQSPRNVYYDSSKVTRAQRFGALGQKGATIWLTGLSGSGKSTICKQLEKRLLQEKRAQVYRLDGDNVRIGLNRDLGFSEQDRAESVRRVGEMAALFADSGVITLVALVSPYRARRDQVRALHQQMNLSYYEVFVDVPLEVAMERDPKGLYKRAVNGEIADFTGISAPYEEPLHPELRLFSGNTSLDDEVDLLMKFLDAEGLLTGIEEPPQGYPGIAPPDGGNTMNTKFAQVFPDKPVQLDATAKQQLDFDNLPRVLLDEQDLHWVQVIGEGWAAPLKGFMREGVYLQSLHFSSVLFDGENLTNGALRIDQETNFSSSSPTRVQSAAERVNLPIPIVLAIQEATKKTIQESKAAAVVLVDLLGQEIALLHDPEIFPHRKEERIARTFGTMTDVNHPAIHNILKSGDFLIGGEIQLLQRIRYNDDLDRFRLTPNELRNKFKEMQADVVLAFQTRNPTHAGHAYLMNKAREQLIERGFKNPVLWLSPLGGWTKEDDVPLDVRVRQHEAILGDNGMLDANSTVLAIWPSPMVYAGPKEVQWHAKSRRNAGASFFVVGRDPAGIKRSDGSKGDLYQGDHGRFVLQMAPGLEDFHLMSFTKVFYDLSDHKMKPLDVSRKHDFLSISGTRMRQMAHDGLRECSDAQQSQIVKEDWEKHPQCVPKGFMVSQGWEIMVNYYQNVGDHRWKPFAMPFMPQNPFAESSHTGTSTKSVGSFGSVDYKLYLQNQANSTISPWHDIPLVAGDLANPGEETVGSDRVFNYVVEIPKGVAMKMEMNKVEPHNPIMADTTHNGTRPRSYLYGVPFFNYGFFPQTWDDPSVANSAGNKGDNDPLDVLEVGSRRLEMGSVHQVKVLGSLELIDQNESDQKVLVLAVDDPLAQQIHSVDDLKHQQPELIARIVDWLKNYKLPEGKQVNRLLQEEPLAAKETVELVLRSHERWKLLQEHITPNSDSFWLG